MNIDLSGLRDIHLPEEPALLPLAWGWWAVLLIGVLLLFGLYALLIAIGKNRRRFVLQRLEAIKNLSGAEFLKEITFLTKQVAIALYGREKVAPLYGQAWADFLNRHGSVHFSKDFVELLEKNMYAVKKGLTPHQKEEVFRLYKTWINENLKRKD